MRKWGGPLTVYLVVILIATIGIANGTDGDKWWVPLLAGFVVVPAALIAVMAVIIGLDALWGYNDDRREK